MPETDVNFPGGEEISEVNQVYARDVIKKKISEKINKLLYAKIRKNK